jgi:rhamnose utilization protein RhaD (predicted bifunctional aldolase and dehydrogenase)
VFYDVSDVSHASRKVKAKQTLTFWRPLMTENDILSQLVAMSNHLGDPALDYAILGEGNTSASAGDGTFWVKASGTSLGSITAGGFVRVRLDRALDLLSSDATTDDQIKAGLNRAKVDPADSRRPSVETVLHALALNLDGVNFVGHTHPTAINALTCSAAFDTAARGRLCPDEIVSCGPASVIVPYTDPGLPLARKVQALINDYIDERGELPKMVLLQNHGLIALGETAHKVSVITAMAVKSARILAGTYAFGGPHFMSPEEVATIHTRPDEDYRRKVI